MITVVSTGFAAPTKHLCLASVAKQTDRHIYIEASEQTPPLTVTENVWRACRALPPDEIVVWLDGDDELALGALATVQRMYDAGADCTYGSFRFSDGRPVALRAYDDPKNCRREPWLGTHLKTFRAGLLASVSETELQLGDDVCDGIGAVVGRTRGPWIDMCCDMAIMFAVLERSQNAIFCPEVLCIYHYASSWEFRMNAAEHAREKQIERVLRSRIPFFQITP